MRIIMKKLLTLATIIFTTGMISAQSCDPDTFYRDSTAGVYPRPITESNPDGGIDTFACIDQAFEFVFTVIIPDTFSFNGLSLDLLSANIAQTGAIAGLPEGIDYACNPPDCVFPADSIGCIILQGTPSNNNLAGDYEPVITMTINTNIFPVTTTFPGMIFPGKYILELRDESCLLSSQKNFKKDMGLVSYPNPVQDVWTLSFDSGAGNYHLLRLTDLSGKVLLSREWRGNGHQELNLDLSKLSSGTYIYSLVNETSTFSGILIKAD